MSESNGASKLAKPEIPLEPKLEISHEAKLLAQRVIAGGHPEATWQPRKDNKVVLGFDLSAQVDGIPGEELAEAVTQQLTRPYDRFRKEPNDPTIHYIAHKADGKFTATVSDDYKAFLDRQITAGAVLGG